MHCTKVKLKIMSSVGYRHAPLMSIIWGSVQRGMSVGIEDLEHPWPGGIENGIGPGEGDPEDRKSVV